MKQEEKDLLLQNLSARLPYGVMCKYYDCCDGDYDEGVANGFEREEFIHINGKCISIEEIKPYLFPLSSITPKQKAELSMLISDIESVFESVLIEINFYHKYHIDYNNLIGKNLAIDCTNLNIYNNVNNI